MSRSILAALVLGLTLLAGCEEPKAAKKAAIPYPPMPEPRRFPAPLASIVTPFNGAPADSGNDSVPDPAKLVEKSESPTLNLLANSSKGKTELLLSGPTYSGEEFDWSAYRGKVVIVLFWASWHPGCREDMNNLEKIRKFYRYRPLEVVAVNLDRDVARAKKFLAVAEPSFPVIMDGEQDFEIASKYPLRTISMPICVNKTGHIISMNFQELRLADEFEAVLKEPYSGPVAEIRAPKTSGTKLAVKTTKRPPTPGSDHSGQKSPPTAAKKTGKKPAAGGTLTKAEVGSGKKGRGYGGGIISEPIRAKFRTEQKLVFDVQIPKAMSLFQATKDRLPNSHEEFMKVIIEENSIVLPELPTGEEYIYLPETGELMVQKPE